MMNSIKTKLILVVVVGMTLISGIVSWIAIDSATQTAFDNATQSIRDLSAEGAALVSARLDSQLTYLEGLAKIARLHRPDVELSVKTRLLYEETQQSPFKRIGFVDSQGIAHFTDSRGHEYSLDVSGESFLERAINGETSVMPPEKSFDPHDQDSLIMTYSVPLIYEGEVTGALVAVGRWDLLSRLLKDMGYGEMGYAYIVDEHGTGIGHPRSEIVLEQYNPIEDARIDATIEPLAALIEDVIAEGASDGSYFFNERQVYASFRPVDQTSWILAVVAEESEMMSGVRELQTRLMAVVAGMLVLGGLIALLIGHSFAGPIIHLENLFTRAAEGDLSVRAEPKSRDEVGRAGHSFNTMMKQMNKLTYYDSVTLLPNFQGLAEEFSRLTAESDESAGLQPMTLFLFAADRFSRVNEVYGYRQGNTLLRTAAQRLRRSVDSSCRLFRGQSDEIILLKAAKDSADSADKAEKYAERLLKRLGETYVVGGKELTLSFSVGISRYPDHGATVEELLQNAGLAKNMAKAQETGQIRVFTEEVGQEMLAARELEQAIALALKRDEFHIEYQPIYDLRNGSVRGVEALLRWRHPEKGLVSPGVFIPLAERSELIHDIGHWVLQEACRQHVQWQQQFASRLVLAVNISAIQFASPLFLSNLRRILSVTGMNPELLELELTETAIIRNVEDSLEQLRVLHQMGVSISIDDFGTGYSSLSYMVQMPVDTLKIDRSFISKMAESQQAEAIVSAITAMGRSLHLVMVAEGIETKEQLQCVQAGHCQLGQGYYLSYPLPPDQLLVLLQKENKNGRDDGLIPYSESGS